MSLWMRNDRSILGQWWWTIDRWTLVAVFSLLAIGVVLSFAASPPVAERIGLSEFHFVKRHLLMVPLAIGILLAVSLLSPVAVRRLSWLVFLGALVLLPLTLIIGPEVKGATRWISLPGLSLQPSELIKPSFAVVAAWLFALAKMRPNLPAIQLCIGFFAVILLFLLLQPDLGMSVVITATWGTQFFLAGLPLIFVIGLSVLGIAGLLIAYFSFDHVSSRVDRFLDPASGDTYQIRQSLAAFENGGIWGTGPGEGVIKLSIPDSHADFVLAVAGEEFGLIWCLIILLLFSFIVLRGIQRAFITRDYFVQLAVAGLVTQFAVQALINMGSTLHMIPTKGMTLPFLSYGGTSLLSLAYMMGILLALGRRQNGGYGSGYGFGHYWRGGRYS